MNHTGKIILQWDFNWKGKTHTLFLYSRS